MVYELRDFSDVAPATSLTSDITDTSTIITVASGAGYPTGGSAGDFMIQIDTELVRCANRTGNSFTTAGGVAGRGQNGTTAVTHVSGVPVNHVHTATNDSKEANRAVNKTIGQALAPQDILICDTPNSFTRKSIGAEGTILQVLSGVLTYSTLPGTSIPDDTITANMIADGAIDHPAQLGTGVVTSDAIVDGTIVDGDVASATLTDRVIASANKDGSAATASMRTLGIGAAQATAGNDTRLSDTRTPTDATVTIAKLATGLQLIRTATTTPASGVVGQQWYDTDDNLLYVYNGTSWVCITPVNAVEDTNEGTASTTYTNLAHTGPQVSINIGTKALVTVTADMTNSVASSGGAGMGFQILDNAAVQLTAPSDNFAIYANLFPAGQHTAQSGTFYVSGITAGRITFKAQYRSNTTGTATFNHRHISVVGIP